MWNYLYHLYKNIKREYEVKIDKTKKNGSKSVIVIYSKQILKKFTLHH